MNNSASYSRLLDLLRINHEEDFSSLLDSINNINERDLRGETLLWKAVSKNNVIIAKQLLIHGANPNIPDIDGFPPFHLAVQNGCIEMIQTLMNAGVDIHALDGHGNNALFRALFCNTPTAFHLIVFLLRKGIDPDHTNYSGKSARNTANLIANYDYHSIFSFINSHLSLNDRIIACQTAFNDMALVDEGVCSGAQINIIEYHEIDRIWCFQTYSSPPLRKMHIAVLSLLLQKNPKLISIMSRISINQRATRNSTYKWSICNLSQ